MTHKKTSAYTTPLTRLYLLIAVSITALSLTNHSILYAADASFAGEVTARLEEKNNALLLSTETPNMVAEKDFDAVRGYESYDPITNTWSPIEAFQEVQLLEDTAPTPDENYIYYSFWAYDPLSHSWKRVDIREYGYKHKKLSESDPDSNKKKKKRTFWQNLGMTFATGGGCTYYINTVNDLDLFVKKGEGSFYLRPPNSADENSGKAYQIKWLGDRVIRTNSLNHKNMVASYEEVTGDFSFHGIGWSVPVALSLHYTFFNKLRVGAGGNAEVKYLRALQPQGTAADIGEYVLPSNWLYNMKWFGAAGYKLFQKGKNAIVVDTQLGIAFDYGDKIPFQTPEYLYRGFYANLGVAHEIRLNDFFKFFYRLSGQYTQYRNYSDFYNTDTGNLTSSYVTLWQPTAYLEIGTVFSFGRDKDEYEEEEAGAIQETPAPSSDNPTTDQ